MEIKIYSKNKKSQEKYNINFLNHEVAKEIFSYHKSYPMYKETPLVDLKEQAEYLGVSKILVKDESHRFGLNAFKVLGGSYAIGKVVAEKLNIELSELPFERLISDEIRLKLGEVTFITATDGNHGRGVAWTANQLKQKAIVYMPYGTVEERVKNIEREGAKVIVHDGNYDDAVRCANELAEKKDM